MSAFATQVRAAAADDDDDEFAIPNTFISPCGQPFRAPPNAPYPVVDWFKAADKNADGKLDHAEIIGGRVRTSWNQARLWLAQLDRPGPIDPGGDQPSDDEDQKAPPLDESLQGAAPYGLLGEPEPVQAADLDLSGVITRQNFLKLAGMHFQTLDTAGRGYLTLATLPKTQVQKLLEKSRPKKRRS
jgi:hypothetical protein